MMLSGEMALRPANKRCFFQQNTKGCGMSDSGGSPALPAKRRRTMLAVGWWGEKENGRWRGGQVC
jgi:hypothetical protein